jgi:hypothetical protein
MIVRREKKNKGRPRFSAFGGGTENGRAMVVVVLAGLLAASPKDERQQGEGDDTEGFLSARAGKTPKNEGLRLRTGRHTVFFPSRSLIVAGHEKR